MTDGDCATVHVHDLGVPAHVLVDRAGLRCKGFVGLHKVEVFGFPAGLFQRLAAGIDRANAHDRRVKAGGGIACDAGQRLDAAFLGFVGAHQQNAGRAVVQAARRWPR